MTECNKYGWICFTKDEVDKSNVLVLVDILCDGDIVSKDGYYLGRI